MKSSLLCLVFPVFILTSCFPKFPDTSSISGKIVNFTIYDVAGPASVTDSTIKADFNVEIANRLIPKMKFTKKEYIFKMPLYSELIISNGQIIKTQLSGNLIRLYGYNGCFEFDTSDTASRSEFSTEYTRIIQEEIIPKRIERNNRMKEESAR